MCNTCLIEVFLSCVDHKNLTYVLTNKNKKKLLLTYKELSSDKFLNRIAHLLCISSSCTSFSPLHTTHNYTSFVLHQEKDRMKQNTETKYSNKIGKQEDQRRHYISPLDKMDMSTHEENVFSPHPEHC